jgi:hypothetical protein
MTDHATTRRVHTENQGLSGSQLTRPSCLPLNPMECGISRATGGHSSEREGLPVHRHHRRSSSPMIGYRSHHHSLYPWVLSGGGGVITGRSQQKPPYARHMIITYSGPREVSGGGPRAVRHAETQCAVRVQVSVLGIGGDLVTTAFTSSSLAEGPPAGSAAVAEW